MAKKEHTVLKVTCGWCGIPLGEKDGEGVSGETHGLCPMCSYIEHLKLAQNLVKNKGLTWEKALEQINLPPSIAEWLKDPTNVEVL
jgi:uncharacterized Zn finger protein (UPF0148 family)